MTNILFVFNPFNLLIIAKFSNIGKNVGGLILLFNFKPVMQINLSPEFVN